MSLHIKMIDPVACVPKGARPTAIAIETQVIRDSHGRPYTCASIAMCEEGSSVPWILNISSEGLRLLARVANTAAEEIEVRNGTTGDV